MAYRSFRDSRGQAWGVWAVVPRNVERRWHGNELVKPFVERRRHSEYRMPLPPEWAHGWLTFQCGTERRRLVPIPTDWAELSDEKLEALCDGLLRVDPAR